MYVTTGTKTAWSKYVQQFGKSPGVEIDMRLKEMPNEMRTRIVAAAESFSEQVKRILEAEPDADKPTLDADTIAGHAIDEINRTKETPRSPIPTDAKAEPSLDRETRLRMIAEAVSGMTYRDWCQTSQKVHQMFTTPVNVARNSTVIDRPLDEIADIIVKQEW